MTKWGAVRIFRFVFLFKRVPEPLFNLDYICQQGLERGTPLRPVKIPFFCLDVLMP